MTVWDLIEQLSIYNEDMKVKFTYWGYNSDLDYWEDMENDNPDFYSEDFTLVIKV